MEGSLKFQFFMSQLTHVRDVKDTEKTHISIVFYEANQVYCILRECKDRDLSEVCRALCKHRHPNAVVVYDYVYEKGNTYILEENIAGTSLEQMISEGRRFSEKETAQMMIAVCDALEPLHGLQPPLVHNDINPSNIMLREDGSIKLFDFDISRLYKQGAAQNTVLFGTEEYASPEHYGYGQSEPRTDIYCMGVTMHKMLTGEILTAEHRMTYGGKLGAILEKCLQLDPKNRYKDVGALRKDLEAFLAKKKRLLPVCAIAAGVILLLGLLLWGWSSSPQAEPKDRAIGESALSVSAPTEKPPQSSGDPIGETAGNPTEQTPHPTNGPSAETDRPMPDPTAETAQPTPDPTVETTQPTNDSVPESTQPTYPAAGNHTVAEALSVAVSADCAVTLEAGLASYYVFTVPEAGQYIVTLENRDVPYRVYYSGDRGLGSLFSGWADQAETATRSFRAQEGDQVLIQVKASNTSAAGSCVLRVDKK